MFYVISGYCGPDNYTSDDGPILKVKEYKTATEVEVAYEEFLESIGEDTRKEKSHITFRVIEGRERKIEPVERVTEYKLK